MFNVSPMLLDDALLKCVVTEGVLFPNADQHAESASVQLYV